MKKIVSNIEVSSISKIKEKKRANPVLAYGLRIFSQPSVTDQYSTHQEDYEFLIAIAFAKGR